MGAFVELFNGMKAFILIWPKKKKKHGIFSILRNVKELNLICSFSFSSPYKHLDLLEARSRSFEKKISTNIRMHE